MSQKLQDLLNARFPQMQDGGKPDVSVYPSQGKIVIAIKMPNKDSHLYITGTPKVDPDTEILQLEDLAFTADSQTAAGGILSAIVNDSGLLQAVQQQIRLSIQDKMQSIMTTVNARLNRPLADGFRSEGQLINAGIADVSLLADQVRIDFRAEGSLRLVYGL